MQGSLNFYRSFKAANNFFSFQGQLSHLLDWTKYIFSWTSHYLIVIKFVCFS